MKQNATPGKPDELAEWDKQVTTGFDVVIFCGRESSTFFFLSVPSQDDGKPAEFRWMHRLAEVLGPVALMPAEAPLSLLGGPPNGQDAF